MDSYHHIWQAEIYLIMYNRIHIPLINTSLNFVLLSVPVGAHLQLIPSKTHRASVCMCGRVCVNVGSLLSCYVDDGHIVGILKVSRRTTSPLFICPVCGIATSLLGKGKRACVSVTVDPHSLVSLLGREGVFGVSQTTWKTHTALCFLHCSVVFAIFAELNQNSFVGELSLVYQTAEMSSHRVPFVYRSLEQTVRCLACQV